VLVTGLTGASPLWDLSRVICLTRVSLGRVGSGQFLSGLRCFARFCEGFFFLAGYVLGVFLFQSLEKSLLLSGTFFVRLL
jgi:hypothetical protein